MDNKGFFRMHDGLNKLRDEILGVKGSEYPTGHGDRLSNFKVVGQLLSPLEGEGQARIDGEWVEATVQLELEPEVVAAIYTLKHVLSLCTFIREQRSDKEGHEPFSSRIADIQNYCDLLFSIVSEQGRVKPLEKIEEPWVCELCDVAGPHTHGQPILRLLPDDPDGL